LDTSLHEVSLQTQHVQDHCSLVLDTFRNLQAIFARRERFLLRPQEQQQKKLGAGVRVGRYIVFALESLFRDI
jgi:hypothetical protein